MFPDRVRSTLLLGLEAFHQVMQALGRSSKLNRGGLYERPNVTSKEQFEIIFFLSPNGLCSGSSHTVRLRALSRGSAVEMHSHLGTSHTQSNFLCRDGVHCQFS